MADEPGKVTMCMRIRRKPFLIGGIHSLGTMSASAYIENVDWNSTCLINYQELTRSI